jgi:Predicted nucleotide-binding protein containing TIR-like domain
MKPSIFIGSSSEGLKYAQSIKAQLSNDAELTIWNEGLFLLGNITLEALQTFGCRFDFAILVLTPDDTAVSRGEETKSPRDNVLFELGVFMSALGPKKTFVVTTKDDVKLPSDLKGLTVAKIESARADGNVEAMVGNACHQIRNAVATVYSQSTLGLLPSTALAIGYYNGLVDKVCLAFSDRNTEITLKGEQGEPDKRIEVFRKNARLVIVMPDKFIDFGHSRIQQLRGEIPGMRQVELKTTSRTFPLYLCQRDGTANEIEFFDIPTTLTTSFEAINTVLGTVIGDDKVRNQIEQREIGNFKRTIERLSKGKPSGKLIRIESLAYLGLS